MLLLVFLRRMIRCTPVTDSYPPELDEVPAESVDARVAASGIPDPCWTWETAPFTDGTVSRRAADTIRAWSDSVAPRVRGVLLHGGAGLGKTGIAACVVRDAAARRVGAGGLWYLATSPKVAAAVAAGEFRRRPAPATFYRWRDLKSLLDRAKVDRAPWEETPPLTAEKVLEEIEDRCQVLALDDVDVDALTPWKEEVMLRLLETPARGRRLVVTMNVDPATSAGISKLGERVVDRLMDPQLFGRFHLTGASIRRRK